MSHLSGESLRVILVILLGWSSFAFADTISKGLTAYYSPTLILALGGLFSSSLLITWILIDRGWRGFLSPNWKWLIARGACIAGTATGVVNALAHIELADLYGITFSAPFIAVLLAFFFLKEQVGWHRWFSVIIGFVGVIILLGPKFEEFNIGILFAGIAAISIALGTIAIRKIGKNEYLPLFILYPYAGILIVNLPMAIPMMEIPDTPYLWGFIANAFFVLVGQLMVTFAISHAKSTASVAPFVYVQVIWGTIFGYFLFDNIPSRTTIIGLILIVSAGLFMIYREKRLNKKPMVR